MKTLLLSLLFTLAGLLILLSPWRSPCETGAYPENLDTSDGQWKKRADPMRIFKCLRTEYGLGISWLVVDRGTDQSAWYAKLHPGVLSLHVLSAVIAGFGSAHLLLHLQSRKKFCVREVSAG